MQTSSSTLALCRAQSETSLGRRLISYLLSTLGAASFVNFRLSSFAVGHCGTDLVAQNSALLSFPFSAKLPRTAAHLALLSAPPILLPASGGSWPPARVHCTCQHVLALRGLTRIPACGLLSSFLLGCSDPTVKTAVLPWRTNTRLLASQRQGSGEHKVSCKAPCPQS